MPKDYSDKVKRYIAVYDGDVEKAADVAGLSYGYCRNLMTKCDILKVIEDRNVATNSPLIATRQRRQEFWTETMEDDKGEMKDRLRASELLGKSEADFTEKVDHSSKDGSMTPPTTIQIMSLTNDDSTD
jgi:hypothetical protein